MLSYGRFSYVPFLCSIFGDIHPKIGVYATTFSFYLLRTTENSLYLGNSSANLKFRKFYFKNFWISFLLLLLALSLTLKREQEFLSLRRSRSQLL